MIVPERFLHQNVWVCFVLGYAFNITLLWLIAKHTTKKMRPYVPILLLSTLTDLVYLAVLVVVVPVLVVKSGNLAWISLGPLGWVPQPYNFALIASLLLCYNYAGYSLVVPFVYRYLNICRKKKYRWRAFLIMLTVPLAACAGHISTNAYTGYTRTLEDQRRACEIFFNDSNENGCDHYVIPIFIESGYRAKLLTRYVLFTYLADFTCIYFFGWRIYRFLTRLAEGHVSQGEYRTLQLQLSSALLLQSVPPLLVIFAPTLGTFLAVATGYDVMASFVVYRTALYAWIPVINPLIPIWVLEAYRRTVIQWLVRLSPSAWGLTADVAPQPNTQQGTLATIQIAVSSPSHKPIV